MQVKATKRGFYQRLYLPGEQFDCPDEKFSSKWMKKIKGKKNGEPGADAKADQPTASKTAEKPPPVSGINPLPTSTEKAETKPANSSGGKKVAKKSAKPSSGKKGAKKSAKPRSRKAKAGGE